MDGSTGPTGATGVDGSTGPTGATGDFTTGGFTMETLCFDTGGSLLGDVTAGFVCPSGDTERQIPVGTVTIVP